MARYRVETVAMLLAKRGYSIHKNDKSEYSLLDPAGRLLRDKIAALDLLLLIYSKQIGESYYKLLEELDQLPPPPPTPAEEVARSKLAKKRQQERKVKEEGRLYPLVPCPACQEIRHKKNQKTNTYTCLSCSLKFNPLEASRVASQKFKQEREKSEPEEQPSKKSRGGRKKIEDGRPLCPTCQKDTLIRRVVDKKKALQVYLCRPCKITVKVPLENLTKKK